MSDATTTPTEEISDKETPAENVTAKIIPATAGQAIAAVPRGERIVKLRIKGSESPVECHIKPLVMFIKEEVQRQLRRLTIIQNKLNGMQVAIKEQTDAMKKAYSKRDPEAAKLEADLEELYKQAEVCEQSARKANLTMAFAVCAIPPQPDGSGGTKPVKYEDVDWDNCEEIEIDRSSTFFLIA